MCILLDKHKKHRDEAGLYCIEESSQANQRIVVRKQSLKAVGPTFCLPPVHACAMSSETSLVVRTIHGIHKNYTTGRQQS